MKIKKVHVYPNVTWKTLTTDLKYDAAILELGEEVKLSAKVVLIHYSLLILLLQMLPICLPGTSSSRDYASGPQVMNPKNSSSLYFSG